MLASLHIQVDKTRLQDQPGKQNLHDDLKKLYEPFTNRVKDTSRDITKTIKEPLLKTTKPQSFQATIFSKY